MSDRTPRNDLQSLQYRVTGMDCPSCTKEIEQAVRKQACVRDVKVSLASQTMTVETDDVGSCRGPVEEAVTNLGYRIARLTLSDGTLSISDDDDELPRDLSHVTPAYKKALWIVFVLNVGYGVIELVAGFIARSQALKADALDFVGDGLITGLGLLAINWSIAWRARTAFLQGLFLGALGLSIIATTAYRVFFQVLPEAELMGIFGAIALLVNVAAAAVLVPHRTGDANVRAIWLFSRNDAIGNLAVVIAAVFVGWSGTPWPDYIVAVVISVLFLQSSWAIVNDARTELRM
jgi:Co/Zn/Cd efflux system component/copper chaperone CopZ